MPVSQSMDSCMFPRSFPSCIPSFLILFVSFKFFFRLSSHIPPFLPSSFPDHKNLSCSDIFMIVEPCFQLSFILFFIPDSSFLFGVFYFCSRKGQNLCVHSLSHVQTDQTALGKSRQTERGAKWGHAYGTAPL